MNDEGIRALLVQVISSWQVWAVTGVLVLYIAIVNNVSSLYSRRGPRSSIVPKKPKKEASEAPVQIETDDLELEENIE